MEVSGRTLFAVFLAVSLLISGVSNEHCAPTASAQELGRATVAAAGVFEGRLEVLGGSPSSSSTLFDGGQLNATFSFRRSHKGRFRRVGPSVSVMVGLDVSAGDSRTASVNNVTRCSVSDLLVLRRNYVVFVGESQRVESSEGRSGIVFFPSTAFPVLATRDAIMQIRAYQCRRCGRIRARVTPQSVTVHEDETVTLTCRTSGKPVDEIRWFKGSQPLTMTTRISSVAFRKGSRLVLANVTSEESGVYQCQAINAVATTPLSHGTQTTVQVHPVQGHETLCASQDYCMNHGTCYILRSLGRKFCRCRAVYSGERCQERRLPVVIDRLEDDTAVRRFSWWMADGSEGIVISGIAVGTLLLAFCLITTFCVTRNYCERKKRRRIARGDSDNRPPSLPDGHAVNVAHLNAAISRRSAAYSISLGADGSIEPIASYPEQAEPRIPEQEFPVLRRMPRSSASSIANSAGARGSGQVRLSMLSNASSQHGFGFQRLAAISSAADADVQEACRHDVVHRRSDNSVNDAEQIEMERVEETELLGATADEMTSPRASQCSHTESLICGMTSPDEAPAGDVLSHVGVPSEASTAPRRHSLSAAAADGQDASDSDVSEPYDGNDLEVNFESEADMLAVETSGDELERSGMATSHDFSELSSQVTTDRGSSDDDDYDDDIVGYPFTRQHLLGLLGVHTDGGSSGDLSWDASAELPSFAIGSSTPEIPTQFSKR